MSSNPLLDLDTLPRFSQIRPEHVEPALDHYLSHCRDTIEEVVRAHEDKVPTWESFILPLELADDSLERAWSPVSHLNSVMNSDELRVAYDACLPKLSQYSTEMGQNRDLFRLTKQLVEAESYTHLNQAQKKTLENSLRGFQLGGIDLSPDKQKIYRDNQQRLSELSSRFEQNLLDATNSWTKLVEDKEDLSGLPDSSLAMLEHAAEQQGQKGYLLSLQIPCYLAVITYADDAELREEMYRAYSTRASEYGDHDKDNTGIIAETLALRHQIAQLLGFGSYAEKSLETKMADSPQEVIAFLNKLAEKSKPVAYDELSELRLFAKQQGCMELRAWDVAYYSEKLKQAQYSIDQEVLKPYFSAPNVLQGLFDIVGRLYGVSISPVENVDLWHDDVIFYEVSDKSQQVRGHFYLDLYARQHKRGGAWMDVCVSRFAKPEGLQTPVAYLTCNATPPIGDQPALFTHDEVITVFHEFGHGLHHMLTQVNYPSVSGIAGVEWDAVELPSQFMENWCWEREALDLFARHWQTNEPLPDELFEKMQAAKNFQSAMMMVRQLEFSLFDFRLHHEYQDQKTKAQVVLDEVREQVAVVIPPEFNRFQNGFSHIFAGGYAAGYYSYKWAEVLSADAFSKFEENGIFDASIGQAFLGSILERGGTQSAMDLFEEFRGRKPSIEPLLKHSGLAA